MIDDDFIDSNTSEYLLKSKYKSLIEKNGSNVCNFMVIL